MKVLIIGGTGLISTGIVTHLLARGAEVTMYNRGKRENTLPAGIQQVAGDRNQAADFAATFKDRRFDVVIDMICFTPAQAEATALTFAGRCDQLIFCSTVCTYGGKIPADVVVDESFAQEPISDYGRNKVTCERRLRQAEAAGQFRLTVIRPSHTYGPGSPLIDQLEFDSLAWDRIERGLPVLIAGDGLGLWQSTHRDDCGRLFAYAAGNPRTYGKDYNGTRPHVFTWRDYYRQAAEALGGTARLIAMPASWIVRHDPKRFGLLREITQFHGAYDSSRAQVDVPEFRCTIDFVDGARATLADVRRRQAWRDGTTDALYQAMVDKALNFGIEPQPA